MLGDLHTCGFFRLKYRSGSPTTSHVIPLQLVQMLNLHRWNCSVCGLSRKMTELNYVRNLAGVGVGAAGRPDRWACSNWWVLPFEIPEWFPNNVARNSPAACSNVEFASLELQRLWAIPKNDRVKLRAKFGWRLCRRRLSKPAPAARGHSRHALWFLPAPSTPAVLGVLVASCSCLRVMRAGRQTLLWGIRALCGAPDP